MQEVERSGASVEEALEAALTELGISEQEAEVEIVQEPKSGFLGLGSSEAVVRVRLKGAAAEEASDVVLEAQARLHPSDCAVVFCGVRHSYVELQWRARKFAAELTACGVTPGDKVALLFPNNPDFVAAFFAVAPWFFGPKFTVLAISLPSSVGRM